MACSKSITGTDYAWFSHSRSSFLTLALTTSLDALGSGESDTSYLYRAMQCTSWVKYLAALSLAVETKQVK
jgi:hypothetical protein